MLVRDYMTRHPLLAEPEMTIVEAQRFMGENNVRHLPVVGDGKRLLGLVTRQTLMVDPGRLGSLDVWDIARTLSGLKVTDVMVRQKEVVTIGPDAPLEEAAQIMVNHKIGSLPVLEEGIVVGMLTETDMLAQMVRLLGGSVPGLRITIRVPDQVGEFAKITQAIASKGWGIYTSGSVPAPKHPDHWDIVIKLRDVPRDELIEVLAKIEGQELIDVRTV